MKMSDVFSGKVAQDGDTILADGYGELADFSGYKREARYAAHAINSHDRMVEEIAELKEALPVIKQMIFSMKTNAHTFSNENVEEVSREGRSAMRLIDKLLAKLNQEGEE